MVYFIHMHFIFIYSKVMKNFTSLMLRLLLRIHQSSKFSLQWLISSNPTQRSIMEISYHRKNDFKFRRLYIRDVLEMTNDNLCWHISTCGVNFEGDISLSASNITLFCWTETISSPFSILGKQQALLHSSFNQELSLDKEAMEAYRIQGYSYYVLVWM